MATLKLGALEFEWNDAKAASNLLKHGVSFSEAATAFLDHFAEEMRDDAHSEEEDRILLLGTSVRLRLVLVVNVRQELRFRLISARLADT